MDTKENTAQDNSRLEELMKSEITPEMQNEFFEILKNSRLLMPVTFSQGLFDDLEGAKPGDVLESDDVGFSISYLTDHDGNNAVPLFTSDDAMDEAGVKSSVYAIYMSDLADLLGQTDKYSVIAINPFTDYDINMPVEAFLGLFQESEALKKLEEMLDVIRNNSVSLEENSTLFLRSDENLMVENAVDGIFTPKLPFNVSSNPKYGEGLKYTNILLMPESKRILPIGSHNDLDVIIAPGTEFHLEDTMDGTTNLWMCGAQPFYDEI